MDFALAKSNPCGKSGALRGESPARRGSGKRRRRLERGGDFPHILQYFFLSQFSILLFH